MRYNILYLQKHFHKNKLNIDGKKNIPTIFIDRQTNFQLHNDLSY